MKTWKVQKASIGTVAYVNVPDDCNIFDTSYAALQLVRERLHDRSINGTQLLDIDRGEIIQPGIPIYTL